MSAQGSIPSNENIATSNAVLPSGMVSPFAGAAAPAGWLLCDGSEQPVATYPSLDAVLGTIYGARTNGAGGAGSTHFRLPDLRGRVPVGVDGAAARLAANDALGNSSGAETHTLVGAEIPDHQHAVAVRSGGAGSGTRTVIGAVIEINDVATTWGTGAIAGAGQGAPVPDGGGDGPHNNLQPYQIVNYMVKT